MKAAEAAAFLAGTDPRNPPSFPLDSEHLLCLERRMRIWERFYIIPLLPSPHPPKPLLPFPPPPIHILVSQTGDLGGVSLLSFLYPLISMLSAWLVCPFEVYPRLTFASWSYNYRHLHLNHHYPGFCVSTPEVSLWFHPSFPVCFPAQGC